MKNTSLKSHLEVVTAASPERIAIYTPHKKISYLDICDITWDHSGSAVVVYCKDIVDQARMLIALDGTASSICPISTRMSKTDISSILNQHSFSHVVTDLPIEETALFTEKGLTIVSTSEPKPAATDEKPVEWIKTTWLVPTSGTTASPKLVLHSLDTLARMALKTTQTESMPHVWALFYDVTRFAGYQVFFQALLGGHTLVVPDLTAPMNECVKFCLLTGVTHISATATLWRKILMCPGSEKLNLQQITLGGEAADETILVALNKSFPRARITHVYASTEAGVGISVSDGKAGFPLSFLDDNAAVVQSTIRDDHLFLRSRGAGQRYAGEQSLSNEEGWINTGDLVSVEGDRFYIVGRASGVLNIGGDKVIPEQVRHVLLEHENILEAHVYGKKNPFTGTLVVADIKLRDSLDESESRVDIENFITEKLAPYQRPKVIRFIDEIKTNLTGKMVQKNEH
ncbi:MULTISPECIES: ANL family adenylate-forming protein [unclassified Halomonas]|uniref:ANL family adenylate-forming protein n=1 Tax=unclassified Halomonas TaxID=2609666 RepID=UPI001CF4A7BD|nr:MULTISPECIES: class I adenylate-forming enzyme family protein [unclassified Halomonas]MCA8866734.1 acyl--CoA ligase [Halomonas sp. SBBP1]UZH09235.1 acyl--CoA ligase [Halomonas sp. BDJS001]